MEAWILRRLVSLFGQVTRRPHVPRDPQLRQLFKIVGIDFDEPEAGILDLISMKYHRVKPKDSHSIREHQDIYKPLKCTIHIFDDKGDSRYQHTYHILYHHLPEHQYQKPTSHLIIEEPMMPMLMQMANMMTMNLGIQSQELMTKLLNRRWQRRQHDTTYQNLSKKLPWD